jgi:crotonobetainyl-CoA:carnitine CoA-transferase CaiB-like acyl-CoA transferase
VLPLNGVRVLDLTKVLAGPFAGYQLARMGAEVLKIENPNGGDIARPQVLDDAQLHDRGFIETLSVAGWSDEPLHVARPGFHLDEELPTPAPLPALGADTRACVRQLGFSGDEIDALVRTDAVGVPDVPRPSPARRVSAGAAACTAETIKGCALVQSNVTEARVS